MNDKQKWVTSWRNFKNLYMVLHIFFPCVGGIETTYGFGVSIMLGPLVTLVQNRPLFHTGHVEYERAFCF